MNAQDEKWGAERDLDRRDWITIIGEEFGEVCRNSLEHAEPSDWIAELVQVAASACQAVENALRNQNKVPGTVGKRNLNERGAP